MVIRPAGRGDEAVAQDYYRNILYRIIIDAHE